MAIIRGLPHHSGHSPVPLNLRALVQRVIIGGLRHRAGHSPVPLNFWLIGVWGIDGLNGTASANSWHHCAP
jgi:hypothetical protein